MSTPVNPLVGQPNLAQQAAQYTPPNASVPAAMQTPINLPNTAAPPTFPTQPQPQVVKSPSPWQRAVHALLGSQTEYQQTPNGPVPIQVQNKPGQLFRSILAGAILGAGAGTANAEHNAGSGWGAAGAGAQAAAQNVQKQQELRQQQAQQQFENQRQVDQDKQQELVRKAQIAQANSETLRMNKEIQGMDFDQHQKMAEFGKAGVQPYIDANIRPEVDNIPESQMSQYMTDHQGQGASLWDWEPTGVKLTTTKDAEGNEIPHYESTYSAYNSKGKITVPDSTLKEWEKEGVLDRFPEYKHVLSDKTLPASAYIEVKRAANGVYADNLAKQKDQLEIKKDQAAIDADNARRVEAVTGTRKINQEISEAALGKTQADQFNKALDELNKAHGNFDALPPSSRVILAESMNKMIPALAASYKDAIAADPTDSQGKAANFLSQIQNISSLGTRALGSIGGGGKVAHPEVLTILNQVPGFDPQIAQEFANLSPDEMVSQVNSSKLPEEVKNKILVAIGRAPSPSKPLLVPNAAGRAVGSAVQQALPYAQQIVSSIP